MAIVIEYREAERLLERVSQETGESVTDILRDTLHERLVRLQSDEVRQRMAAIREIQERIAAMPLLDARDADEIIGYNEHGHFD